MINNIVMGLVLLLVHESLDAQDSAPKKAKFKSGNEVAKVTADKIAAFLNLRKSQHNKVYQINVRLQSAKQESFNTVSNRSDLQKALQSIENSRDSLYAGVLTTDQMIRYKTKKRYMLSIE